MGDRSVHPYYILIMDLFARIFSISNYNVVYDKNYAFLSRK